MQFTLQTLMIAFIVIACALGVFGIDGIYVATAILVIAVIIRSAESMSRATFLVLIVIFLGFCFYIISQMGIRDYSRHRTCSNNIHTIAIVLCEYEGKNNHFPPSGILDSKGNTVHSWRLEILPAMDQLSLYKQYQFHQPWNGPSNSRLSLKMPEWFNCPEDIASGKNNCTSYVAVTGPNTLWPEQGKISLKDIPDGAANTILLIEMHDSGINWLEPRDFALADWTPANKEKILAKIAPHRIKPGWFYKDQQVGIVAFADGRVAAVPKEVLAEYLPALCSRNGGEKVDLGELTTPELDWPRISSLIGLIVSTLVLIYRPRQGRQGGAISKESSEPDRVGPGEDDSDRADTARL